jgi:hypothetical protein
MTYSWLAIFRQAHVHKTESLSLKLGGREFPNDRKPLADIVAEGYFRE